MKRVKLYGMIAGLLALGLFGGCSATQTSTASYDVKTATLAADDIALAYLAQPACTGPAQITCVDPAVKLRIKAASAKATAARHAYNTAVTSGQAPDLAALMAAEAAFSLVVGPYATVAATK